ncbi:NAD(P)H-binding protein [Hymenobacter busanensis]|uniref:NAD(P)H-binding protein n=1 Tax=Hymenobacter busanensis TaxID=2607656 RepID=A0A7L4ZSV7_9BACT|nr:NAD(P)H-binding protein [Hymenobacter busanensis]KAA9327471.1 NAD(P)H-binding protein [Hymenobacter busanensis]QHJ06191.1 NAD(P)H-binding protein [Hymenobacter busanensis]
MNNTFSAQSAVAVIGCGWLGLPLARTLVQHGHAVAGTTTTPDKLRVLQAAGIRPHVLCLSPETSPADVQPALAACSVLVLNVPPGQRRDQPADPSAYPNLLRPVFEALRHSAVRHVVFVSSTGVYPDEPQSMSEDDALASPDASHGLLRAEWLFQQPNQAWQTTVLRFGGLIGPGRAPGRFLAGRTNVPQPTAPVNLLHLADAIGVVRAVIDQQAWGHTLNVCAEVHPTRQTFYTDAAHHLNLPAPQFRYDGLAGGKSIDTVRLHDVLRYQFVHPDPTAALGYCL